MRALAFSVHILTACGAALALIALIAAARGDWAAMFLALGLALIVDAVDGPLARRLNVAHRLPRWSGETLDLVVDFATYVFVPAYAIAVSGLIPADFAVLVGAVIAIAGALYFADREMKTPDNYFRGFPGVWNLVAFYLLLLQPAQWIALAIIALFVILTFLPIRFVHPFRVAFMRPLTLALLVLWAALALLAVLDGLKPTWWVTAALCAIGVYFLTVGCIPQRR
ncbi:MAG TPA: CDP-alcohol phosphatidyltransferase family protein [Xanthobacteraceae bacterium]|nr:CDP-alcohol phosphatidyltransferase family protein [Xanthobacteraceae bacterium]